MKITDIRACLLSCPLPEPLHLRYYGGERTIFKRDAAFLRITTDCGQMGYGPAPASETAVRNINTVLRDALLGKDPTRLDDLRNEILAGVSESVALAFGGVEVALHDLLGKAERCPVYALLGGKVRDRIRLYGSAGMYQSPAGYAAEAEAVAQLGFQAYKMRPACGEDDDLEAVRLIRAALGREFGIMVDAHTWWRMGARSYSPGQIERLARAMAAHGLTWLEEPLPPEDRAAYARLRAARIVPIAAGEHETSLAGFQEIIRDGAVDIVQADVTHHGGYSSLQRVLAACAEHARPFTFHNWGTLLETVACAHLGVCFSPDVCPWLEYPCYRHRETPIMYPFPLADDILTEPLTIESGTLVVNDRPGLGVTIDEAVIERYPFVPGPWSVFQIHEPPEAWALTGDHAAKWEGSCSRNA